MNQRGAEKFFRYARLRHEAYLRRAEGGPPPWTKDKIIQSNRFTNVFRELDKTTIWFRRHVRDPLRGTPEVLLATVVFRLFNRIEIGEAIWGQKDLEYESAFAEYCQKGDVRVLRRVIRANVPNGPYCTGAYIISSPAGYSKLDGVLRVIDNFQKKSEWRNVGVTLMANRIPLLQDAWSWLKEFDYFGPFHSYEIVTDLRHTTLLERAPDKMTWANIGPGCRRGLNRILFGEKKGPSRLTETECLREMAVLLSLSRDGRMWPQEWGQWEMREVEHTLCEFDKYERVRNGEGKPRGSFP